MGFGAPIGLIATTATVEYDTRVPVSLRVRRALALPIYAIALVLSFLTEGLSRLAEMLADDPR